VAGLKVTGLREFQRACRSAEKATRTEVTKALRDVGGPVRDEAEQLAQSQIRNVGARWSGMKVGSSVRSVYIRPSARRAGGSPRPNLGGLLMRQMIAAAENKQDETIRRFEEALDRIADVFERR
jgi:hypothetical protein